MNVPISERQFCSDNAGKVFYYVDGGKHAPENIKQVTPVYSKTVRQTFWKLLNEGRDAWLGYDSIFENESEAEQFVKTVKHIRSQFRHDPYVSNTMLLKHFEDFKDIENKIEDGLKDYPNFDGIDFCDVSAHGIQVRTHHKAFEKYTYGSQFTIEYDFSNKDEIPNLVINNFKNNDNEKDVKSQKRFIAYGEKYGWD